MRRATRGQKLEFDLAFKRKKNLRLLQKRLNV